MEFPEEWIEIVEFIKYMRDELLSGQRVGDVAFSDYVTLFCYLLDSYDWDEEEDTLFSLLCKKREQHSD